MKLKSTTLILAIMLLMMGKTSAADFEIVSGKPAGCPTRWCMCAVSLKLWGRIIPDLNLASNWLMAFMAALPAPGMVAARSGHGFLLQQHVEGKNWKVYDCNTWGRQTGGKSRCVIHIKSIAGYKIVNPQIPTQKGEKWMKRR